MKNDETSSNDRMTKASNPVSAHEAFLAALRAESDIAAGRVISDEEMKANLELLEKRFANYLADPSQAADAETVFERLAARKRTQK